MAAAARDERPRRCSGKEQKRITIADSTAYLMRRAGSRRSVLARARRIQAGRWSKRAPALQHHLAVSLGCALTIHATAVPCDVCPSARRRRPVCCFCCFLLLLSCLSLPVLLPHPLPQSSLQFRCLQVGSHSMRTNGPCLHGSIRNVHRAAALVPPHVTSRVAANAGEIRWAGGAKCAASDQQWSGPVPGA